MIIRMLNLFSSSIPLVKIFFQFTRKATTFVTASVFFLTSERVIADEMKFNVIYNNHTNIIVADGSISSATPQRFQEFLDSDLLDGFIIVVHFNSDGGDLLGGLELGRMIRKHGFTTGILSYGQRLLTDDFIHPMGAPGRCFSACALAFLGGEQRSIESGSIIGFHQFSSVSPALETFQERAFTEASTQILSSIVLDYVYNMGVDIELFRLMSFALPDDLFIPTKAQQKKLMIVSPFGFSSFSLEPFNNGVVAYSSRLDKLQGREIVSQITTFCRAGAPHILLSGPPNFPGLRRDWVSNVIPYIKGFELSPNNGELGIYYSSSDLSFRTDSRALVEVRLDEKGVLLLLDGALGYVDLAGSAGYSFTFSISPDQRDIEKIISSFRHCIS